MMLGTPKFEKEVPAVFNSLDESLKKTKPGKAIKTSIDGAKKKPQVK